VTNILALSTRASTGQDEKQDKRAAIIKIAPNRQWRRLFERFFVLILQRGHIRTILCALLTICNAKMEVSCVKALDIYPTDFYSKGEW
jgi:hypothetical protein